MKLNSKIIKEKITEYIKLNPGCIKKLFDLEDQLNIDELELTKISVWKRTFKEKCESNIHRYFSALGSKNEAIVDQITAEIITNEEDTEILSLIIEG